MTTIKEIKKTVSTIKCMEELIDSVPPSLFPDTAKLALALCGHLMIQNQIKETDILNIRNKIFIKLKGMGY